MPEHAMTNALRKRPTVGGIVVPYMVDETRSPIDFKAVNGEHVRLCAEMRRCGICGAAMKGSRFAFLGPADGRVCFGDPWMHEACARYTMAACPFASGKKREYRDPNEDEGESLLLSRTVGAWALHIAEGGHGWRDQWKRWHFEARTMVRVEPYDA